MTAYIITLEEPNTGDNSHDERYFDVLAASEEEALEKVSKEPLYEPEYLVEIREVGQSANLIAWDCY